MGKIRLFASKHDVFCPMLITLVISVMYISWLPFGIFEIKIAGENIFYILNMLFVSLLCIALTKLLYRDWQFGLQKKGFHRGFLVFGWTGLVATVALFISSYFVYSPFDLSPSVWLVVVWVIFYYFCVSLIEEIFLRGVLLNALLKYFNKNQNGILWAVLLSSSLFGLGHIPGIISSSSIFEITAKVSWTTCLGIYLAAVYLRSNNLWSVIALHGIMDVGAGILISYSSSKEVNVIGMLVICIALAIVGLFLIRKNIQQRMDSPYKNLQIYFK